MNISLSETERQRLERLASMRGGKYSRAVNDAVIHLLATIESGEPVHYVVPSEQAPEPRLA
jgi:hypothetical protein